MTLQQRLSLIMALVMLGAFAVFETMSYVRIRDEALQELQNSAERVRSVLMATRRVYHRHFIDSGLPLTEKTIPLLPAYAMSRISAELANWDKSGFSFNNVSDRPRNPKNQADAVELAAIRFFRANPEEELRFVAFANGAGEEYYHYARPIRVEAYCLKCHGRPEDAPESIRAGYDTAFGYQVGELRGILSIKVPATHLAARIEHDFRRNLLGHLGVFLLLSLATAWLIRRYVVRPLTRLHADIGAFAAGDLGARAAPLPGEFGEIGDAFNHMARAVQTERQQLAASEERFRSIAASAADAIIVVDQLGHILFWNAGAERLFGFWATEMLGQPVHQIIPERYRGAHLAGLAKAHMAGPGKFVGRTQEVAGLHRSGRELPIELSLSGWTSDGEHHFAAIIRDISERKRIEASLRLSASVFAAAREGIVILDGNGTVMDVNRAFTTLTGIDHPLAIGHRLEELLGVTGDAAWPSPATARGSDQWQGEVNFRRHTGETSIFMLSLTTVSAQAGGNVRQIGLLADITALKLHQEELERIAHHDPLTQLPNRLLLIDRLQLARAQTSRRGGLLAVCYLDLDGFKPVNDAFGHEAGDQLLKEVAQRLRDAVRGGDTVARLGGDEFVLLLGGLNNVEEIEQALNRLLAVVAVPYGVAGQTLSVSASVGVTLFPSDDGSPDLLLRHADEAMYVAKASGRNRFRLFNPEQDRLVHRYRADLDRVRQAFDNDELCLLYQPKLGIRDGRPVGLDAQLMWQHPDEGLLPPARFMPLVEDSDLAVPISQWLIRAALRQAADWAATGIDLPLSLAVSPRHLQTANFIEWLSEALTASGVPARRLGLEIPEATALADMATVSRVVEQCRRLGVPVALDDFGAGSTSLGYLKRLEVGEVKIAAELVGSVVGDAHDRTVVRAIIGLAHAFGHRVVAAGVDEPEQAIILAQYGCDAIQGKAVGRPLPATEVPASIERLESDEISRQILSIAVSEADLPLLSLRLAHRRWQQRLTAYLDGTADALAQRPVEDPSECDFGRWYEGEARGRYGDLDAYARLDALHRRFHELAGELLALKDAGEEKSLLARLPELQSVGEAMVERMQELLCEATDRTRQVAPE